jgi:hypothetical protein
MNEHHRRMCSTLWSAFFRGVLFCPASLPCLLVFFVLVCPLFATDWICLCFFSFFLFFCVESQL